MLFFPAVEPCLGGRRGEDAVVGGTGSAHQSEVTTKLFDRWRAKVQGDERKIPSDMTRTPAESHGYSSCPWVGPSNPARSAVDSRSRFNAMMHSALLRDHDIDVLPDVVVVAVVEPSEDDTCNLCRVLKGVSGREIMGRRSRAPPLTRCLERWPIRRAGGQVREQTGVGNDEADGHAHGTLGFRREGQCPGSWLSASSGSAPGSAPSMTLLVYVAHVSVPRAW